MKKFIYKDVQYFYSIDNPQNLDTINFNNHQLNNLRIFCKNNFPGILEKKRYELYFYEGREINAVSFLDNKDNGIIAFPSEFFTYLMDLIKENIYAEKSRKLLDIYLHNDIDYYVNAIFEYIIKFVVCHELTHIAHGHCGYLRKLGFTCNAKEIYYEENNEETNFLLQTLELEADSNAIFFMLNKFMYTTIDLMKENNMTKSAFFEEINIIIISMYLLNIFFNAGNNTVNFDTFLDSFYFEDHPFPSLRVSNILTEIQNYMKNNFGINEPDFFNEAISNCYSIDTLFCANGDFKKSLIAVSATEKGVLHLKKLYKNWNKIFDEVKKFSFIPIKKKQIPKTMIYWVDENGDISDTMFETKKEE